MAKAEESYADLVEQLMPSVVNISIERQTIDGDDDVDNLMVNTDLKGRESLGSGFFIRRDGYILTNEHVIRGAKTISVITDKGNTYEAKIAGTDKMSDLAVLKISGKKTAGGEIEMFPPVLFGNADNARIGDKVLTFGNPYGLGVSVSQGIISAKSRNIGLGNQPYIQTDAAINQGNSGGPMFNLGGEVIGINAAIFTENGASGVGFALPANIASWVANQLIDKGKVRRGWHGMSLAKGFDRYTEQPGLVITEIDEQSNAFKEGLRVGDVITAYNGKAAENLNDFQQYAEMLDSGQEIRLSVLSYGEESKHTIRIQEMPASALKAVSNKALLESNKQARQDEDRNIFYISEFKTAVREANPKGLMIVKIERRSPLYGKGIKEGDIILEADRSDIYSQDNLLDSINDAIVDDYRPISLLIQGTGNTFYSSIELVPEND